MQQEQHHPWQQVQRGRQREAPDLAQRSRPLADVVGCPVFIYVRSPAVGNERETYIEQVLNSPLGMVEARPECPDDLVVPEAHLHQVGDRLLVRRAAHERAVVVERTLRLCGGLSGRDRCRLGRCENRGVGWLRGGGCSSRSSSGFWGRRGGSSRCSWCGGGTGRCSRCGFRLSVRAFESEHAIVNDPRHAPWQP